MVNLKIDNIPVSVPEGTTILEAARSVNIEIPTLCYLKGMNEIAACRICCVELVGHDRLIPACDNVVAEGMEVLTNSHKVREARRSNLRLLLSHHDVSCTNCTRSGNCTLQSLANDFNMRGTHYPKKLLIDKADITAPLIRENNKCVMCMRCIQICEKVQTVNIWDLLGTGSRAMVDVSRNRRIKDTECTYCGQCITHCPTAAIRERDDTGRVYDAIDDENIVTVVQVAPAVRAAWAERYGLDAEFATPRRMAAALRRMGFDYVFDTDFTADLTIMEEGSEFIERFTHKDQHKWPMFTSCCPGWVRFLKSQYPELTDNLSTAKSPQQMFGAVIREYYRNPEINQGKKLVSVSIMPCTAKKEEILRPESMTNGRQDVDYVLTTTEVASMIRKSGIRFENIDGESTDMPFGIGSGGGVIFGVTGGVTEAVLRRLQTGHSRVEMDRIRTSGVRGDDGLKELTFDYMGKEIRAAVVNGLGNADKLIKRIQSGEVSYDFVEVMACRRGCIMGGGQPVGAGPRTRKARAKGLYDTDVNMQIKKSNENPMVLALYEGLLKGKTHQLLHRNLGVTEN